MSNLNKEQNTEQLSKKEMAQLKAEENKAINARLDENYDGYYNDVLPAAEKSREKEIDKEMVKKIALIAVGGIAIIAFSVFLMFR